jgi:hypothetical protein
MRITDDQPATQTLYIQINQTVFKKEIKLILRALSTGKALGSDSIFNKILKILVSEISKGLAHAISKLFADNIMSVRYQKSTTLTLHKKDKKDYSLSDSYHSIALENTLIKVVKKVLTN